VTRSERLAAALLAALFVALHLPFLPTSLEDLDSINFALGIGHFDVAQHQPHPPGYPIYIALAKAVHLLITSEAHALAVLGVVGGGLAAFALLVLYSELDRDRPRASMTWLAVIVTLLGPLFWLTAERPLSDVVGLTAALAVQAALLAARTRRSIAVTAAAVAFAAGIRSQIVWLTLPLLLYRLWQIRGLMRSRQYAAVALAFAAGGLAWFVPLIVISGGPLTYWHALFSQGADDLSGVKMLATTPTIRQLATVLQYTLIEPWGYFAAGLVLVALALAGVAERIRAAPRALLILALAFGPYAIFDVLFQESITTRYALPLMIPMSYLAVRGCALIGESGGVAAAVAVALFCAWTDDVAMYQYSRMDAPAFRLLADMAIEKGTPETPHAAPVLAMHRREDLDMRRPIVWAGLPPIGERLPAPPKHEWLEAVKYWNRGGRAPMWYVADPLRSDLALIGTRARPKQYRWALQMPGLIGGVRPNIMDWYTIAPPDWYLGEGWAVTPETGGVAREDRRGPGVAPISGWIRRWREPTTLMIGGRNLGTLNKPARVRVAVDAVPVDELTVAPGFFLRMITLPGSTKADDYAAVTVEADNTDLAVEQFDAEPAGRLVFGFDEGWYEREYNPATGALWRWASDRAVLRVRPGSRALALTLRGEIEQASSSRVTVRSGERVLAQFDVGKSFARTVILPAGAFGASETTIALESSASFVPAETRWRSRDRRRLALKLYECTLTPVS
jgi:hypothetical protein